MERPLTISPDGCAALLDLVSSRSCLHGCLSLLAPALCLQGDSISLQYTGTGSVFSSQIKQGGKSSLSSNIDHALKSIGRSAPTQCLRFSISDLLAAAPASTTALSQRLSRQSSIHGRTRNTRCRSWRAALAGLLMRNAVCDCRFYHNTFEDSFRQECVDLLVGQHRLSGLHSVEASTGGGERQKLPYSAKQMSRQFLPSRPSVVTLQSPISRRRSPEVPPPPHSDADAAAAAARTSSSSSNASSSTNASRDSSAVPLRVWIGTWNVAGREIHEWDNLEDWLTPVNEQADIFVFCVQELVGNISRCCSSSRTYGASTPWLHIFAAAKPPAVPVSAPTLVPTRDHTLTMAALAGETAATTCDRDAHAMFVFRFCKQDAHGIYLCVFFPVQVELTGLRVLMSLKDRDKESRLDIKTAAGLQGIAWTAPPPAYLESRRKALDRLEILLRRSSSICSGDVSLWAMDPSPFTQGSQGGPDDYEEADNWQQQEHHHQQERTCSRGSTNSGHVPSYVKVRSVSMVGLWISIYVRADLRRLINSTVSSKACAVVLLSLIRPLNTSYVGQCFPCYQDRKLFFCRTLGIALFRLPSGLLRPGWCGCV